MSVKIALAGNPNSGKTTMFNDLTGSSQYVGNWPGVTVEKKEGKLKGKKDVIIQDLPGIYSLSPYTLEEVVARNYLINERPDSLINIVDASNIERNLYLTTQLVELGLPVVLALNMIDIVRKKGDTIDIEKLGKLMGCEVVETSAITGVGSKEAAEKALLAAQSGAVHEPAHKFAEVIEDAISEISGIIEDKVGAGLLRFYAIKLFERDEKISGSLKLSKDEENRIDGIASTIENEYDDDSESIITNERYNYIAGVIKQCVKVKNRRALSVSDKIDRVVTNRVLALPIFAGVMFLIYFVSINTVGAWMTDWVNDSFFGDIVPNTLGVWLESVITQPWLYSLIMDGIVAGVGAVLGFVPQMLVLFLCLAILEDCGYMARIAFIMDRVFRRFGLSGKSFIPILIGTGCGVPGIMASRTIENENDRRMTVITTTFMPCGAKLPIIALIAGAFFPGSIWVAPSAYFIGIAAILVSGILLKKTKAFAGKPSPFVMELPAYHRPRAKGVLIQTWDRGFSFIKKAGTIILISSVVIWFLSSFNTSMEMVETGDSMLASVGHAIAPVFSPLGWGQWQPTVATLTGFVAKEQVVGTFGVLYGFAEVAENGMEFWPTIAASMSALAAFSFLVFNLLCAPCFAAIGAAYRELGTKWTIFSVTYQMLFAYAVALIIYQFGMWFSQGVFGAATAVALVILILLIYLVTRKPYEKRHPKEPVIAQRAVR